MNYKASKSQSQGRPGWSIVFRHPLRESEGKPGKKVRRGLGTTDDSEADRLVEQMNQLLGDKGWWSYARRADAEQRFDSIIVSAFYDRIQAGQQDSRQLRDEVLPLPQADDGYARVLLVGTTGAGKTSLLRHAIGSHPDRDRFPSTSTAKTTTADIEVVLREGVFEAVVTFMSRALARTNIEECIADACLAVWEEETDSKVASRLLSHRDQRFRLSYVLGHWSDDSAEVDEDDWTFEGDAEDELDTSPEDGIPTAEAESNAAKLREVIGLVRALATATIADLSSQLGEDVTLMSRGDRDAARALFEETLSRSADFARLTTNLLDDIVGRFDLLNTGSLNQDSSGWPTHWRIATEDRFEFLSSIRWFSSNYAPQFGRLLTPLVDGVRVAGPLFPVFTDEQPKLVLLDGQGLGHTPDSSAAVTTNITEMFDEVDVVLLVDNAQQPMQAAPIAVIRAVATGGHQDKLHMAFTHFDLVRGANLRNFSAKRDHVLASVTNGLTSLREVLGQSAIRPIERNLDLRTFMLGALDKPSEVLPKGVVAELLRMFQSCADSIEVPEPPPAQPVYHPDGLLLAVQGAAESFQLEWRARLGLGAHKSIRKEHWTRVKALNRRLAEETNVEYDTLRPMADLVARLGEEIALFLESPTRWCPSEPDEAEADAALSAIRRTVYAELHKMSKRRLMVDHLNEWREANAHRGSGSTTVRAQEIDGIYRDAAPVPRSVMPTEARKFLAEVRRMVQAAIEEHEGRMEVDSL